MKHLYRLYSWLTGKNSVNTPPELIKEQLSEKRALPTGVKEFHEWSDRIISGAMLTATEETQKYTLANILLNNCGPTIAFETDLYFIHVLRKHAVNQVADAIRKEIYANKQKQAEVTPPPGGDVLEIKRV